MTNSTANDGRNDSRRRVLKSGTVAYNGRHVTLPCSIRDFSENGARITVQGSISAPDTFDLLCDLDGLEVPCQVVWRRGMEVGVRFVQPPQIITERKRAQVVDQWSQRAAKPTLRKAPRVAT